MSPKPQVAVARAKVAGLHGRPETDPEKLDARRELQAAKLQAAVEKALASAPRLTDDQRNRIAALLRAGGDAA